MSKVRFQKNTILRTFLFLFIFVLAILLTIRIIWYGHIRHQPWKYENISCFYEEGGLLPYIDEEFSPSADSIYFHETSCKGDLDSRQACAVEAAARAHPKWLIYVLIVSPVKNLTTKSLTALKQLKNVNFYRVNLYQYSRGTPLESLALSGALNRTKWRFSHTSDFLRYLTLFKWGGIYLDLDTIVVRNLEPLGFNWAARESDNSLAAGALAFSRDGIGRNIAKAAVRDLQMNWRGDKWPQNGPCVINRVLHHICRTTKVRDMSAATCNGFEVHNPEVIYPVHWRKKMEYFRPQFKNYSKAYIHHTWNALTKDFKIRNNSLFYNLGRKYCPTVFDAYSNYF